MGDLEALASSSKNNERDCLPMPKIKRRREKVERQKKLRAGPLNN